MRRLNFPLRTLAGLAIGLGGAGFAPAQATFFQADDGNSFFLVPLPTQTVHWINLQPARPDDEPIAFPGLALAVARASLLGAASPGDRSTSPLAWETALRQAPSSGAKIVQVDDHIGVAVTFRARSMARIAEMLRFRTRRNTLQGIQEQFQRVRVERRLYLEQTEHLQLIRDALDACHREKQYGALFVRGSAEFLDMKSAMAFYRWNSHPTRCINVIVGGFDPVEAKRVLGDAFRVLVAPAGRPSSKPLEAVPIESRIPPTGDTVMLAYPLPARHTHGLDVLATYLAHGRDSYLVRALTARGHQNVEVRGYAPFPGGGRTILIQVRTPDVPVDAKSPLAKNVRDAMATLRSVTVGSAKLHQAELVLRARRMSLVDTQEGLGLMLARQWVRANIPNPEQATEPIEISAEQLRELARKLLAPASQHLLLEQVQR